MTKSRGRPPHNDLLTPGEWRVVEGVRHGLSNPGIAARLGISPDAVKFHVANALAKLGLAGRQDLRRWDGVRRGSALHDTNEDAMNANELGPIGQIARTVGDIDVATRWYRDVLGLKHLYTYGKLAFFDCGGVRLFLSQGDAKPSESILYFRVDNVRAAHRRLQARGAVFTSAPHLVHRHDDGMEEWMGFFNDNEGRTLGIMAQARPKP
jgi:DNA-binding CsgD family transcriptional regulator/catechol 2,3-dioxygenase-like lactoylglutathione lyase family enzyme